MPTQKAKPEGAQETKPQAASIKGDAMSPPARRRGREAVPDDAMEQPKKRRGARRAHGAPAAELGSPTATADDALDERDRSNNVLMDAVVKRKRQYSTTSSGFIISGRRILTNAHSVDHHTQVKVKKRGSDEKYLAQVLAIGTECDIAMLTVHDDSFWEGVQHVRFGNLPRLQDSVTVIGFPIGGDTMSVTSGVVSRIEVTSYVHGSSELLGIQIDAAINSGNSGGPSFSDQGECVGIAFQSLKHEEAENIGYVIPPPVIEHFITDYERNGRYTGFPALGIEWQKMESPALRAALGMKAPQKGVLVRRVEPTCPSHASLKSGDILMAFDDVEIANDGTVPFRSGERIGFSYLVSNKYSGDTARLKVLSGKSLKTVDVVLAAPTRLIPVHINNKPPSYFIFAGLVFTTVTIPYLRSEYGKEYDFDAPVKLLDKMMHAMAQNKQQQVVVLGHVLANDATIGYEDIINTPVKAVNGTAINNMRQLVDIVQQCKERYLRLDLEYNQTVILDTKQGRAATHKVLETHCIPADRSADLADD